MNLSIRPATVCDASLILAFIRELAVCELLAHEVDATQADIAEALRHLAEEP
ncbi:hypothetical protein GGR34_000960 [Microvirga flocculans]|uniref:GNAT family N-acetyltransferase n=1 Tax=Microvirga flocculans TaxID=217168 RepID=A0A7W6IEC1_9HYPH|nr:hypothetical protein [Microvirga flocculans]MBB4039325.1 hypothetical protein [Microvirga flocculans]